MDAFATHQPILLHYAKKVKNGKIIEFGSGFNSTEVLHNLCKENNNELVSIDHDESFLGKFYHLKSETHKFLLVKDYSELMEVFDFNCNLAFVDAGYWGARAMIVDEYKRKKNFDYMILHDSDYFFGRRDDLFEDIPLNHYNKLKPPTTVFSYKYSPDETIEGV